MLGIIRQIVSGKKNRYQENGVDLDLTYVTKRIIGMAFPAQDYFEQFYRNPIDQVAQVLNNRHGKDYLVINLSGRDYDYSKFNYNVMNFKWEDHHSPSICILFQVCQEIHKYLSRDINRVVVVHCLAGKGRTGTAIACYLIYSGRFDNPQDALDYYATKRFEKEGLGVTQPAQIRYVHYFYKIYKNHRINPEVKMIESIIINTIPQFNSQKSCKPYIEIYCVKTDQLIYSDKKGELIQYYDDQNNYIQMIINRLICVCGDILIKVKNSGIYTSNLMFRLAFNTAFIKDNILQYQLSELDPDSVSRDSRISKHINVEIKFANICSNNCNNLTLIDNKCTGCMIEFTKEEADWRYIYDQMSKYQKPSSEESVLLVFGDPDDDDMDVILQNFKKKKQQNIVLK